MCNTHEQLCEMLPVFVSELVIVSRVVVTGLVPVTEQRYTWQMPYLAQQNMANEMRQQASYLVIALGDWVCVLDLLD